MSDTTTRGVRIQVRSAYLEQRSDPTAGHWFFVYQVRISNVGEEPVQLLTRHWVITDATGNEQHVRGAGVIGEQPHIPPGGEHVYTSACPLGTSMGTMHGSYGMVLDDGTRFDAVIAPFVLADPLTLN